MPLKVKDLMARGVVTVPADATVGDVLELLARHHISGAPVVDQAGRPIGVISRTDLLAGLGQAEAAARRRYYRDVEDAETPAGGPPGSFTGRPVREVMMPMVFSVQQDDPVRRAAQLMHAEGIHRLVVLDGDRLVGILSASDIVAAVARGELTDRP